MAPEQLAGLSNADARVDQYAMGVLLYEMLAGQVPTGRFEPLNQVRKVVPRALSEAVDKALSPKAANRFPDIQQFRRPWSRVRAEGARCSSGGAVAAGVALVGAGGQLPKLARPDPGPGRGGGGQAGGRLGPQGR